MTYRQEGSAIIGIPDVPIEGVARQYPPCPYCGHYGSFPCKHQRSMVWSPELGTYVQWHEACIHVGVFAHPDRGCEFCWNCNRYISRQEL